MIPVLFIVSVIVFVLIQLIPGDPAVIYTGEDLHASPEYLAQVRKQLGLDQPIYIQYLNWLGRTLHGDLGTSAITKKDVSVLIADALPRTLYLSVVTIALAIVIGIPCGILSALHRNTKLDLFLTLGATFGVAMPSFWLAIILILVFSVQLGLLPTFGFADPFHEPLRSLQLMILPALTLGLHLCASIMRQLRSSMLGVLTADHMRTAYAKGLGEWTIVIRHGLRNAMIPVVTIIGIQAAALIGGTVIVESIFAIPGIGRLMVQSIASKDFPVLMGTLLIVTAGVLIVNLLVDLSYSMLDPRIRYS
jgi:peptide/nickel transport system permease protein